MSKPDNHIDDLLEELLLTDPKADGAGLDFHELKHQIEDFYRNKILEARIDELKKIVKLPGHYGARDYDMECHNRINRLTAQFNRKGDNDE